MVTPADLPPRPYTRIIWALIIVAVLLSVGLLVAAGTLPAYYSASSEGGATAGRQAATATLVEANGPQVLAVMALPLLASLVVAVALLRRHQGRGARLVAWGVTGLLGIVTLLGLLTVGLAMVPVTGCLVLACALDWVSRAESSARLTVS